MRSNGRVRGTRSYRTAYSSGFSIAWIDFQYPVQISENINVPEPQYDKANCFKCACPFFVGLYLFGVLSAIKLNDEFRVKARKISNVTKQRHLTAEFAACHLAVAESRP